MRLFLVAVGLSAAITSSTAFAQFDEPLVGGSVTTRSARFEESPAQQYLIARARADATNRQNVLNYYHSIGYDYGHPQINSGVFYNAQPPIRIRRIYSFPGIYMDSRAYGF
ncbi:MAG: hypothetical protein ACOVLE_01730 [Pirellula staleyi]